MRGAARSPRTHYPLLAATPVPLSFRVRGGGEKLSTLDGGGTPFSQLMWR